MKKERIIGVIPARYASSRLPGKPLKEIGGKSMIQWVVERVSRARSLDAVLVATDDERIADAVQAFGGRAVMTPVSCPSGTDRVAAAVKDREADIVVNIQGDEPFIAPEQVDAAAGLLNGRPDAHMGTLVRVIDHADDLLSPHTAKVVLDNQGCALYFSRSPIPFYRDAPHPEEWFRRAVYYKHIGIYSYRKPFLLKLAGTVPSGLEQAEKLEQLRVLQMGEKIHVAVTPHESPCVDTEDDLIRARAVWRRFVTD